MDADIQEGEFQARKAAMLEECKGTGWRHHQTLSLLATWFLVSETRWEKKWTPAITLPQIGQGIAQIWHRDY